MDYNIREIQYLIREALLDEGIRTGEELAKIQAAGKKKAAARDAAKPKGEEPIGLEQAKCLALESPYYKMGAQDLTVRGKAVLLHEIVQVLLSQRNHWKTFISQQIDNAEEYGETKELVSDRLNNCVGAEVSRELAAFADSDNPKNWSLMDLSPLREELTKTDESDIKKMIAKELESAQSSISKNVKKIVEEELGKMIQSKDIKDDITDITKKVMKRLYKDLSYHHPYIIDRIKV